MSICTSELPNMLSLASGALTLNLAYLNLERFRYSRAILNAANDVMDRLERKKDLDFSKTRSYKELSALIGFPNAGAQGGRELKTFLKTIRLLYRWIFVKRADTIISGAFVTISTMALLLGSGHGVGLFGSTCKFFTEDHIVGPYLMLASGIGAPMSFLLLGRFIQRTCRELAERIEEDLGQVMQKSARELTPLDTGETTGTPSDAS